jgi:hypothetical protein
LRQTRDEGRENRELVATDRVRIICVRAMVCGTVQVWRVLILGHKALGLELLDWHPGELREKKHIPVSVAHLETEANLI